MRTAITFLVLAIVAPAFGSGATGVHVSEEYTLKGFKEVNVFVEDLGEDATRNGLTKERLLTDAELRLRANSIPVVTMQERLDRMKANGDSVIQWSLYVDYHIVPKVGPLPRQPAPLYPTPQLRIKVSTMLHHDGLALSYSVHVQFQQCVILIDNQFESGVFGSYLPYHPVPETTWKPPEPPIRGCTVATWERSTFGFAGTAVFAKAVREAILDELDDFSNDWLAVNGPNAQREPKDGKE